MGFCITTEHRILVHVSLPLQVLNLDGHRENDGHYPRAAKKPSVAAQRAVSLD